MECGLHNGPIEVWPGGSHMWTTGLLKRHGLEPNVQDGRNPVVERLAEYFPSIKVVLKPGEILIRDLAMWHRGTPNRSQEARPNLALIYSRPWLKTHYPPIEIPQSTYEGLSERARKLFRFEKR